MLARRTGEAGAALAPRSSSSRPLAAHISPPAHQIGLVEHDPVSVRNLLKGFIHSPTLLLLIKVLLDVLGVDLP